MTYEHEYEDAEVAPVVESSDQLGDVLARRSRDGWELVTAYWMPARYGHGGTHRTFWRRASGTQPTTQPAARPFPLCANGPRSVAGGVTCDEAGTGAPAGRPAVAAGRALGAGVEAQSGDDHVGVPGVGVDRDPSARTSAAV
jgi:hypothetical protein